jgi:hypothetical protein
MPKVVWFDFAHCYYHILFKMFKNYECVYIYIYRATFMWYLCSRYRKYCKLLLTAGSSIPNVGFTCHSHHPQGITLFYGTGTFLPRTMLGVTGPGPSSPGMD